MAGKVRDEDAAVTGGPMAHVAFVAGATGYTGSAVVVELRRRGIATIAHVRPDSPDLEQWRERFTALGAAVDTCAWDEEKLIARLAGHRPDAVFALLGTTRARSRAARRAGRTETYETVDYGLTSMLLRATAKAAPAARFVYLSSFGVGPVARGSYLRARWRVEQELQASRVPWTIVRPAVITGPDRPEKRRLERIAGIVGDAVLRVPRLFGVGRRLDRYRSITAPQLARGLVTAAFDGAANGAVLHNDRLSPAPAP